MEKTTICKKSSVRFFGDDVSFQFSRNSGGSRKRIATVCDIKKIDDDAAIEEMADKIIERSENRLYKAKKRHLPFKSDDFSIYVGKSAFRFRGEDQRRVLVWGLGLKGKIPMEWQSYKQIY